MFTIWNTPCPPIVNCCVYKGEHLDQPVYVFLNPKFPPDT
jgi:hypothetical protein